MPALRYDLIVDQGADYERTIPVLDEDGQPTSVVGWTVTGQIRDGYGSATVLATLDVTPVGNTVVLSIPAATSELWSWRLARYDVELVAPDDTVVRFLEGSVVVRAQITDV